MAEEQTTETEEKSEETTEEVSRDTTSDESTDTSETKDSTDESKDEAKDESTDDKSEDEDGAPEAYADFKIPEGFEVNDEKLKAFQEFGQQHKLTQEGAQELIDLHVAAIEEVTTAQQDAWEQVKTGWENEVKADKALHDDQGKADAAIATAKKAAEVLGVQEALDATGAGSHPAVVKAFFEIGKRMEEGRMVFGAGNATDSRTTAEKLYPSMKKGN